jgi:DNA-binding LytR/AlgR family response regulator
MTGALMTRTSNGLAILNDHRIAIREGASMHIVQAYDIVSVHANRNVTRIAIHDCDIRVYLPFTAVLDALRAFGVVRIHRGSAVNMARVRRVIGRGRHRLVVVLDGGAEHSVGRAFQAAIRARINGVESSW